MNTNVTQAQIEEACTAEREATWINILTGEVAQGPYTPES